MEKPKERKKTYCMLFKCESKTRFHSLKNVIKSPKTNVEIDASLLDSPFLVKEMTEKETTSKGNIND